MISSDDLAESAMCLWEEVLNHLHGYACRARETHGTAELRLTILALAEPCHLAWEAAVADGTFDDSFDWEWCPKWLAENVVWDGDNLPILR